MRALLFLLLVTFSTASLAHRHHHYRHYGYGYTNFYFVPGNVVERDVVRVRGGYLVDSYYPRVYYWPDRQYKAYYYNGYGPRAYYRNYYWW